MTILFKFILITLPANISDHPCFPLKPKSREHKYFNKQTKSVHRTTAVHLLLPAECSSPLHFLLPFEPSSSHGHCHVACLLGSVACIPSLLFSLSSWSTYYYVPRATLDLTSAKMINNNLFIGVINNKQRHCPLNPHPPHHLKMHQRRLSSSSSFVAIGL